MESLPHTPSPPPSPPCLLPTSLTSGCAPNIAPCTPSNPPATPISPVLDPLDLSESRMVKPAKAQGPVPKKKAAKKTNKAFFDALISMYEPDSALTSATEEHKEFSKIQEVLNMENGILSSNEANQNLTLVEKTKAHPKPAVQFEERWLGTTTQFEGHALKLQIDGWLESFLAIREQTLGQIEAAPYDPQLWIELGGIYSKLGFTDVAASAVHKGLLLIDTFNKKAPRHVYPGNLQYLATGALRQRYHGLIYANDQLAEVQRQGYERLLEALEGCSNFWDGLLESQEAIKLFPNDTEIMAITANLKRGFAGVTGDFKRKGNDISNVQYLTRTGSIYVKEYPWLAPGLNFRTPTLLKQINDNLAATDVEVKPLFSSGPTGDVGPLGLFARRDIAKGDLLFVDDSFIGASSVSPATVQFCEFCHAALFAPYSHASNIFKAECCEEAAYCSQRCRTQAIKGYHRIICKKDFKWLYEYPERSPALEEGKNGFRYSPCLLLRVIAQLLADKSSHPLQHPLVARMTANYNPGHYCTWNYLEDVVIPTRILMQLGIDVFTNKVWTQEVVQTIKNRLENNISEASCGVGSTTDYCGRFMSVIASPNYLFFNHCCHPNVTWYSSNSDHDAARYRKDFEGRIRVPGSFVMFCYAQKDVKEGEELKISYMGDILGGRTGDRSEKRAMMSKWFQNGCGCQTCEKENLAEEQNLAEEDNLALEKKNTLMEIDLN